LEVVFVWDIGKLAVSELDYMGSGL